MTFLFKQRLFVFLIISVILASCKKFDIDWIKPDKTSEWKYVPEVFYEGDRIRLQSFYQGNMPMPYRLFYRTWADDSLHFNLLWKKDHVVFISENNIDTLFRAFFNKKNQVVRTIPSSKDLFSDHLTFEYNNNRVSRITYPFLSDSVEYIFNYDEKGNCELLTMQVIAPLSKDVKYIVDQGIYKYDLSKTLNNQFYFVSNDILLRPTMEVLDFIGLIPGMQSKNLRIKSFLSPYHGQDFQEFSLLNHKVDLAGNLIEYTTREDENEFFSTTKIKWKKVKKN